MRFVHALAAACLLMLSGCGERVTHCVNPLTYTDIPDNDVIRVGDDYYMVSTTMYFCPGAPVMHSRDLVHWRIVSYIYDFLEDDDVYNLRNGRNAYGKGQWATTLRYHDGEFYALFIANDQGKTYVYHSPDITASNWERKVIDRPFHDAGLLFEDGRAFVVWGNGNLRLTELEPDLSAVKQGGLDTLLIECPRQGYMLRGEGAHFYHIGDWYYVLEIDWPRGGVRTETCWRSRNLTGPYESRVILQGSFDGRQDGVAQGAIFDTPAGDWYSVMFQDHGAVGRIPTLQRVTWDGGWPMLGDNGTPEKEFDVPLAPYGEDRVWASDEFDSPALDLVWQWNHKPLDGAWSLEERPGFMRIHATPATTLFDARNTLTQRTVGPACESSVKLDVSGLKAGAHAGLAAFQSHFGALETEVGADGEIRIMQLSREGSRQLGTLAGKEVWFKIKYDFSDDSARFLWSADGESWEDSGFVLGMRYTLDFFTGYRSALYCYGTEGQECGFADFDWFRQIVS